MTNKNLIVAALVIAISSFPNPSFANRLSPETIRDIADQYGTDTDTVSKIEYDVMHAHAVAKRDIRNDRRRNGQLDD